MIAAHAILKKAAAVANHRSKRLEGTPHGLITQSCEEILAGQPVTCKAPALKLGFVAEAEFVGIMDPEKMVKSDVDTAA